MQLLHGVSFAIWKTNLRAADNVRVWTPAAKNAARICFFITRHKNVPIFLSASELSARKINKTYLIVIGNIVSLSLR